MLIRYAERRGRRLAVIDLTIAAIHFLAETFSPKLFKPECEFPQRLRVGKQNENAFCALALQHEFDECSGQRRIFEEGPASLIRCLSRAGHKRLDVETHQRRRQSADRGEHAETASHIGRNHERRIVLLAGDGEQVAFFRVCRDDESFASFGFADSMDHPLSDGCECRHRLGRDAGFRDDIYDRVPGRNGIERILDEVRIDVIQNNQTLPGIRTAESRIQRRWTEGGAANSQQHNIGIRMRSCEVGDKL